MRSVPTGFSNYIELILLVVTLWPKLVQLNAHFSAVSESVFVSLKPVGLEIVMALRLNSYGSLLIPQIFGNAFDETFAIPDKGVDARVDDDEANDDGKHDEQPFESIDTWNEKLHDVSVGFDSHFS